MKADVLKKGQDPGVHQVKVFRKPAHEKTKAPSGPVTAGWLAPVALLVLSAIPLVIGALRLTQLAGGSEIMPDEPRFAASPLPLVLHIMSAILFTILGAFQFATGFRRRWPAWHRAAGRLLVLSGLLVGLSALWMTLFYPRADGTGDLLYAIRLLFGSGMLLSIVLGFAAIRQRDFIGHRAWMMRAYAIGLGAGTQALTLLAGELIAGPPSEISHALLMGAGWAINLVVAEWFIRRRPARRSSAVEFPSFPTSRSI